MATTLQTPGTAVGKKPMAALILLVFGGLIVIAGGIISTLTVSTIYNILSSNPAAYNMTSANASSNAARSATLGFLSQLGILSGVIGVICGLIVLIMGMLMLMGNTGVDKVHKLGIVAIIFSFVSLINGGGFLLGFILALVGSILAIRYKG